MFICFCSTGLSISYIESETWAEFTGTVSRGSLLFLVISVILSILAFLRSSTSKETYGLNRGDEIEA